jgi:hypothetical protein
MSRPNMCLREVAPDAGDAVHPVEPGARASGPSSSRRAPCGAAAYSRLARSEKLENWAEPVWS